MSALCIEIEQLRYDAYTRNRPVAQVEDAYELMESAHVSQGDTAISDVLKLGRFVTTANFTDTTEDMSSLTRPPTQMPEGEDGERLIHTPAPMPRGPDLTFRNLPSAFKSFDEDGAVAEDSTVPAVVTAETLLASKPSSPVPLGPQEAVSPSKISARPKPPSVTVSAMNTPHAPRSVRFAKTAATAVINDRGAPEAIEPSAPCDPVPPIGSPRALKVHVTPMSVLKK